MGNKLTQEEQTLSNSLQQQYFFQSNQFLVHKATQRPCTLHRISTFSKQQSAGVERNIALYNQSKCNSISKLKEYFELDNSGYCSDQSKFYLVFDGHNSPNIKQEYFSRRYAGQKFYNEEIESILSCMLCGLRHYSQVFNRKESRISLESVCIDRSANNTLWLKDPWLVEKLNDSAQIPINFLASYPSPQKIQASNQASFDFNQFRSDLFSIGIFGLQFLNMNFRDDLYAHKKFVDRQRVNQSLNSIQDSRLRGAIGILLSEDPEQRMKIYRYWDIQCLKTYRINSSQFSNLQTSNVQKVQSRPYEPFFPLQPNFAAINSQQIYPNKQIPISNSLSASNQSTPTNAKPQTTTIYQYPAPPISNRQPNIYQGNPYQPNLAAISSNRSTFSPSPPKQSSLAQQFSKPLLMKKNSMSEKQKLNENSFKKRKPNVVFQSQIMNQPVSQPQPSKSQPKHPNQPQKSPQITINNKNSMQLSQSMQSHYEQRPASHGGYPQTPKFNYQSPILNNSIISPSSSFGYNQAPVQGNQNMVGSFNINSSIKQSQSTFSLHPQTQTQMPAQFQPSMQQRQQFSGQTPNFNFTTNSPSSTGNSPILTKSIINPIQPMNNGAYSMQAKISSDQTTQVFSNNPSARQTKHISQSERNSSSPTNLPQYNISQKDKLSEEPLPHQSNQKKNSFSHEKLEVVMKKQSNLQIITNIHSSPEQNSNAEDAPTSPSTTQLTPPPPIRNPNKYNSTIVEVNEETPNQSSESENENAADIQYIVQQYETGSKYEGFKKNGLRHGRGKFFYQDGGYYDGQWKKNQMHGWGKLFYEGGQLAYQGNWAHDQFHGYGKVYNDNPVVLEGGFDYTNFDLLDDYWLFYQGMLANDTKEGRGRIQLTNKQIFEGDFHADRIQGFGKFLRRDGTIVEGIWRDSRLIKVLNSSDIYK